MGVSQLAAAIGCYMRSSIFILFTDLFVCLLVVVTVLFFVLPQLLYDEIDFFCLPLPHLSPWHTTDRPIDQICNAHTNEAGKELVKHKTKTY